METQQRDMVEAAVLGVGTHAPPRRWPVREYRCRGEQLPAIGQIVSTIPGAYWRVRAAHELEAGSLCLALEALHATSLEAHGQVTPMPGGILL